MQKTKTYSAKIRNKMKMLAFTIAVQYCSGSSSQSSRARKGNKSHPDLKGRSKTLFTDDSTLYIENPQRPQKILPKLTNKFSKVTENKINAEKSIVFLCTSNKQFENKLLPQKKTEEV